MRLDQQCLSDEVLQMIDLSAASDDGDCKLGSHASSDTEGDVSEGGRHDLASAVVGSSLASRMRGRSGRAVLRTSSDGCVTLTKGRGCSGCG
jgi:hypothetical protein